MFWKKKENPQGLPDLPPLKSQSLPPPPEENTAQEPSEDELPLEKHGLPSFPDSPIKKGFSQEAIKDAISASESENEVVNLPQNEKTFKTVELEEWSTTQPAGSFSPIPVQTSSIPSISNKTIASPASSLLKNEIKQKEQSDIYIKIDKFYSAKRTLDAAEQKLEEIDELLRKIRETKLREEQELSAWEKDLAALKTRVKEVTSTLLDKA